MFSHICDSNYRRSTWIQPQIQYLHVIEKYCFLRGSLKTEYCTNQFDPMSDPTKVVKSFCTRLLVLRPSSKGGINIAILTSDHTCPEMILQERSCCSWGSWAFQTRFPRRWFSGSPVEKSASDWTDALSAPGATLLPFLRTGLTSRRNYCKQDWCLLHRHGRNLLEQSLGGWGPLGYSGYFFQTCPKPLGPNWPPDPHHLSSGQEVTFGKALGR